MKLNGESPLSVCARVLLLFGIFLVVLTAPAARAATCSLATVKGNYAVADMGQGVEGVPVAVLFLETFDGNGNISGSGEESLNGTIYTGVTLTGTYNVSSTCWYTATVTDTLGNTTNFEGSVLQNGAEVLGLSVTPGGMLQRNAYRLSVAQCTQASYAGSHTEEAQSLLTPLGAAIATERWTVNKMGSGSVSWVSNFSGNVLAGTATTTVAVNSDCTFTTTSVLSTGGVVHHFGVLGIGQDDVKLLFMFTDSGWVGLGTGYNQ